MPTGFPLANFQAQPCVSGQPLTRLAAGAAVPFQPPTMCSNGANAAGTSRSAAPATPADQQGPRQTGQDHASDHRPPPAPMVIGNSPGTPPHPSIVTGRARMSPQRGKWHRDASSTSPPAPHPNPPPQGGRG